VIVADTGAIIALVDADDQHHQALRALYEADPDAWQLPWAILPEIDYLLETHVSPKVAQVFRADLAAGAWPVVWGEPADLDRAYALTTKYSPLRMGLVDAVVMAVAERVGATAVATLDERHFGAVRLKGKPRLFPRDG
jgi:predicted nucleic acid-binding protein